MICSRSCRSNLPRRFLPINENGYEKKLRPPQCDARRDFPRGGMFESELLQIRLDEFQMQQRLRRLHARRGALMAASRATVRRGNGARPSGRFRARPPAIVACDGLLGHQSDVSAALRRRVVMNLITEAKMGTTRVPRVDFGVPPKSRFRFILFGAASDSGCSDRRENVRGTTGGRDASQRTPEACAPRLRNSK